MKKIAIFIFAFVTLTGCDSDILNLTNPNMVTTQTFWKTEEDVLSGITATYSLMATTEQMWGNRGILIFNGRGDDHFLRNDMQPVYQATSFTNTPDNTEVRNLFSVPYRMIFRANQVIEATPGVPGLDDSQKATYIGEAKFLRALCYFMLVTNWGDVPLRLTVPQSRDDYFVKQSPQSEVWKQIIADFRDAAEVLPLSYPSNYVGRATKGAALAFLGKSYLYTEDWANVVSTLTPLTQSPYTYRLMENFGDNFIKTVENNEESIFEVQFQDISGLGGSGHTSAQMIAPSEVRGWFQTYPTNKLFHAFQKEKTVDGELDPRMYATLVWDYEGAMFYNRPFSEFQTPFPQYIARFKKYQNYDQDTEYVGSAGSTGYSDNNERIMRYDYVLLMLAEAHTMLGQLHEANTYLKPIRKRAHLDENKTDSYTQAEMLAEIRHQCMLEFVREGQRFYDLRRWGILRQEIMDSDKEGREFFVEGKHDYFPIPQDEINANPLIEQNPYWK
jgi:hypothetical protein